MLHVCASTLRNVSSLVQITCRIDQGNRPFNLTRGESGAWPYNDFLMTGGNGCAPFEAGVEVLQYKSKQIPTYLDYVCVRLYNFPTFYKLDV